MNIKYHVHHKGDLQRSLVEDCNTTFRRLHRYFDEETGDLADVKPLDSLPVWQEQTATGDFKSVLIVGQARALEAAFVTALIANEREVSFDFAFEKFIKNPS